MSEEIKCPFCGSVKRRPVSDGRDKCYGCGASAYLKMWDGPRPVEDALREENERLREERNGYKIAWSLARRVNHETP